MSVSDRWLPTMLHRKDIFGAARCNSHGNYSVVTDEVDILAVFGGGISILGCEVAPIVVLVEPHVCSWKYRSRMLRSRRLPIAQYSAIGQLKDNVVEGITSMEQNSPDYNFTDVLRIQDPG